MIRYDPIAIYFLFIITYILEQEFGMLDTRTHLALMIAAIAVTTLLSVITDAVYHAYERSQR